MINDHIYEVKHILDIVMQELISNTFKYCISLDSILMLLHNNIKNDFQKFDLTHSSIVKFLNHYFNIMQSSSHSYNTLQIEHYNYFSIKFLYDFYINKSKVYKKYGETFYLYLFIIISFCIISKSIL